MKKVVMCMLTCARRQVQVCFYDLISVRGKKKLIHFDLKIINDATHSFFRL